MNSAVKQTRPIVVNFKTNASRDFFTKYFEALKTRFNAAPWLESTLVLCPPLPYIDCVHAYKKDIPFQIGAQNCIADELTPLTGEVTARMLVDLGVSWVILGHSERRLKAGESALLVREKIESALQENLKVILCVGENSQTREEGTTLDFLTQELDLCLPKVRSSSSLHIAYEPLWAVGAKVIPSPDDIVEVCQHLKSCLNAKGIEARTLYGGSVTAENAHNVWSQEVDGLLLGRAGLDPPSVSKIIKSTPSS